MIILNEGGSGSGNFGHKGRPGKKGGSAKTMSISKYNEWAKEWSANIDKKTFNAIYHWTGTGYRKINSDLRSGKSNEFASLVEKSMVPLKDDLQVFRCSNKKPDWLVEGCTFVDKGLVSTSISRNGLGGIGLTDNDEPQKILYKIKVPKNTLVAPLGFSSVQQNKPEYELLLQPKLRYKVKKVINQEWIGKGHYEIHLEVING